MNDSLWLLHLSCWVTIMTALLFLLHGSRGMVVAAICFSTWPEHPLRSH